MAVFSFVTWVHAFLLADRSVSKAMRAGKPHPWRKFRLQDRLVAQEHFKSLQKRQAKGEEVDMNEPPPKVTEIISPAFIPDNIN